MNPPNPQVTDHIELTRSASGQADPRSPQRADRPHRSLKSGQRAAPGQDRPETLQESARRIFGKDFGKLTADEMVRLAADRRAQKQTASLRPPFSDVPDGGAA